MQHKMINDASAWLRSLAQLRGRNQEWAEKAVREAASLAAEEALSLGVIDILAEDQALLLALNGRKLSVQGRELTLDTTDVQLSVIADPNIAYLTADKPQQTPFARCFAIDDVMPFQLKRLRKYCRDRNIGRVTIKKRGSPLDPDALRLRLRLRGDRECTIFLTQVMGKPTVLIGRPLTNNN